MLGGHSSDHVSIRNSPVRRKGAVKNPGEEKWRVRSHPTQQELPALGHNTAFTCPTVSSQNTLNRNSRSLAPVAAERHGFSGPHSWKHIETFPCIKYCFGEQASSKLIKMYKNFGALNYV